MRYLDIDSWNRKQHFSFFNTFSDPYFAVTAAVDVTNAFKYAKEEGLSFFAVYLHACMRAINAIENFKYRIHDEDQVVVYNVIHASPTILREDTTFGFSFIHFNEDLSFFSDNIAKEKARIFNSDDLFPPTNTDDCIYCSAMPWINFTGHKEPVNGNIRESVPKLAFGKAELVNGKRLMNVSVSVNHALMDGYHVGLFFEKFQNFLNHIN
ncbi:CatA-like O-acetyltransferase [Sungkyunkwania multivorans]|uniref:CatA-like O-acetyltransferase n=1 Tax=Sungkyunkwania multivorans TaxID=1173618 RepID=A0ABW3CXW8_9FLAO